MVPSFALFEFVVSRSSDELRANNAKGGSCVVNAAVRSSLGRAWCHLLHCSNSSFRDLATSSGRTMLKVAPVSSTRLSAPHGGVRSPEALLIGGSKVPSFTLFGFVASQLCGVLRANNAKGGSCVVEAARRSQLAGETLAPSASMCYKTGCCFRLGSGPGAHFFFCSGERYEARTASPGSAGRHCGGRGT